MASLYAKSAIHSCSTPSSFSHLSSHCIHTGFSTWDGTYKQQLFRSQVSKLAGSPTQCVLPFSQTRAKLVTRKQHLHVLFSEKVSNTATCCSVQVAGDVQDSPDVSQLPEVETGRWIWEGHSIRYMKAGDSGPIVLLIHGFGANCLHWRKNLAVLGECHRVYAIDLLGYGLSDKPDPRTAAPNSIYNFENWSRQVLCFLSEVAGGPAFIISNSIGGLTGLQAAVDDPDMVRGLMLLNVSLRMLHVKKQKPFVKPFIRTFQNTLRTTNLGRLFFSSVAKPQTVTNILRQAYYDKSAVTEELVDAILQPGLLPGAVDVFLDFISYSAGPLPEDLLPRTKVPVVIGWGDKDPWEPIELGREYAKFDCVKDFVVLPNVGHCPQDEAPHLVNPLIKKFVAQYTLPS